MATKTNSQRLKELRKKREEESKKASSNGTMRNSDKVKKLKAERTIGFDTFESDLQSMGETINNIYSGWQDADTMKKTKTSVEEMYGRIKSAQEYFGDKADFSEMLKGYEDVLGQWDDRASYYGMYKNAKAFDTEMQRLKFDEQFKGLTYDEVKAEQSKYKMTDPEWLYLQTYSNYTDLNDFDKAIKGEKAKKNVQPKNIGLKQMASKLIVPGEFLKSITSEEDQVFDKTVLSQLERAKNKYKLENGVNDYYAHYREADDFAEHSQYVPTELEGWWDKLTGGSYGLGYGDLTYEYINDVNGARSKIQNKASIYADGIGDGTSAMEEKGYHRLNPEERQMYNYLYYLDKQNGTNEAEKYLEGMEVTLGKRIYDDETEVWKTQAEKHPLLTSAATVPANIIGGFTGAVEAVGDLIQGKEYNPYGYNKTLTNFASDTRKYVGEDFAEKTEGFELFGTNIPQFAYQTIMSMADTTVGGHTLGPMYSVIAGSSAFQQTAKDMKEQGENDSVVWANALANGIAEMAFEYLSIDKLLSIDGVDGLKKGFKASLKQAGIEASEEFLTELANIASDQVIRGDNSELIQKYKDLIARGYTEKEASSEMLKEYASRLGEALAGGFLSGGILGASEAIGNYRSNKATGKQIAENDRKGDMLDLASMSPQESEAYKAYTEYAKKGVTPDTVKPAQLGNLYNLVGEEVQDTFDDKTTSVEAKASAMERMGKLDDISKPSEALIKKRAEEKRIEDKEAKMEEFNAGEVTEVIATGNSTTIEGVKTVDGERVVVTSQGEFKAEEMNFNDTDRELMAYADTMTDQEASLFIQQYDGQTNIDDYQNSFALAVEYASNDYSQDTILQNKGVLTESQVGAIYTGIRVAKYQAQQNAFDSIVAKQSKKMHYHGVVNDSVIDYTNQGKAQVNWKDLSESQRKGITFLMGLGKASGFDVELVTNGLEKGFHGAFIVKDGKMLIDVYAGKNKFLDATEVADTIVPTMSHELTHRFKTLSPERYMEFGDHVLSAMSEIRGMTEEELIQEELDRLHKNKKLKDVDAEYARDEIIARACEDMLAMSETGKEMFNGLSEAEKKTLWEKVKDIIKDLADFVNELLSHYSSKSKEATALRQYKDKLEALAKEWDAMFKESIETNQALKNEGVKADDVIGEVDIDGNKSTHKYSIRSMTEGAGLYFEYDEETGGYKVLDREGGKEVTSVTKAQLKNSPLGNIVGIAVENEYITKEEAEKQYGFLTELVNMCLDYQDNFTMVWEIAGTQMFSAIKSNSDTQYGKTIDFSTVCKKTQQVINVISKTQVQLNRGLTRDEIKNLVYGEVERAGEPVPCPVCYVFSRWMGIGGILQQMKEYQSKYKNMSEADMLKFIEEVEQDVYDFAFAPSGKARKPKASFFDKNGTVKKGTVIADMKSKASSKVKSSNKAINKYMDTALEIKNLEELMGYIDEKQQIATQKKIDKLKAKLGNRSVFDRNLAEAEQTLKKFEEYQWLIKTYMDEVVDEKGNHVGWKKDENFKPVDEAILFDLNRGAEFASKYPKSWKYRTTKGCNAGKAILPYSDARVGETIQGVSYSSVKDIMIGKDNAFLNGDKESQRKYITQAIRKQLAQNLIGGMRFQSTSDFRYEYGSDYLMTFLELQAIGGKVQLYTKVIEAVDFLASVGAEVNLSVMPFNTGHIVHDDGRQQLLFSPITGINGEAAIQKSKEYDNVQLILVGISDEHIRLAMRGDDVNGDIVSFIIPFHGSGNTVGVIKDLMEVLDEKLDLENARDYSLVQTDHFAKNRTAEQKATWDLRTKIISRTMKVGDKTKEWDGRLTASEHALLKKNPFLDDLYNRFYVDQNAQEYGIALSKDQAGQIFPYEYWDKSLTYDQADQNGERFKQYCATMGIVPRFSGVDSKGKKLGFGNFTADKGYWKLLIDRKMYNNDGTYHEPSRINVTNFSVKTLDPSWGTATYGDVMQKDTDPKKTNAIVENVIRQLETKGTQYSDREDARYERLAQNPSKNEKKLRKMLDKAARVHGFTERVMHGTSQFGFTQLKATEADDGISFFATSSMDTVETYSGVRGTQTIGKKGETKERSANYDLYANTDGFLVLECHGQNWADIQSDLLPRLIDAPQYMPSKGEYNWNTRAVSRYAKDQGYRGVLFKNLIDDGGLGTGGVGMDGGDIYNFFYPQEQVKSADLVTYDADGKVIPLSQRFNAQNDDIRYSDRDSDGRQLSKDQIEFYKKSKVRGKDGKLMVLYHGTTSPGFTVFDTDASEGMFYMSSSKMVAGQYSNADYYPKTYDFEKGEGDVYEVYANIQNPLIIDATHKIEGKYSVAIEYNDRTDVFTIRYTSENGNIIDKISGKEFYSYVDETFKEKDADRIKGKYPKETSPYGYEYFDGPAKYSMKGKQISLKKPTVYDQVEFNGKKQSVDEICKYAKSQGYDGVIVHNVIDDLSFSENGRVATDVVAFHPNQIKLTSNTNPTENEDIRYSDRVTDEETLDFLNEQIENGEYITVYRSFQVIDGGLYAPMNAVDRDENGKNKRLGFRSEYGQWEMSTESPEIAQRYMDNHPGAKWAKFDLDGVDNKTNGVAYNPYLHASNLVLNDQFSAAYRRKLITVECRVPLSEIGAYKAEYAKDTTGWVDWKPGGVAGKLAKEKPEYTRKLFVSRYMLPVRRVPESEVAQMYKEYLEGTDITIPWNVVTPELRKELEKIGVKISYDDVKQGSKILRFSDVFGEDAKLSAKKITPNMSDDERYEILKSKKISIPLADHDRYEEILKREPVLMDKRLKLKDAKKLLNRIGKEFGIFTRYENADVELEFEFGSNNLRESLSKQNAGYTSYLQMMSCFSDVISNAIGIECHNRNKTGYKVDETLEMMYVLCSAFETEEEVIPVKLEIKEFKDKPNRLYVAISLNGIQKDRVISMGVPNSRSHVRTSPVIISVADLLSNINRNDASFVKYIPKQFLQEEQFSDRDQESTYDIMGQNERLKKRNQMLMDDLARLRERVKLEAKLTKGKVFDAKQLESVARYLTKQVNSTYNVKELSKELEELYTFVATHPNFNEFQLMSKFRDIAVKILNKQRGERIENQYYLDILKDLRGRRFSLSEEQIKEVKSQYGDNYRNYFLGKVLLAKDGISLESQWQELCEMYPDVFEEEISDADQPFALLEAYDLIKESSVIVQKYEGNEATMSLAIEIYNKFWSAPRFESVADKWDEKVKRINLMHRNANKEMRADFEERLEKQKSDSKEYYGKIIADLRQREKERVQEAKEFGRRRVDDIKAKAERKVILQRITKNTLTLNKWLKTNSKDAHIHEAMKGPVINLIKAIDFSSKQLLGMQGGDRRFTETQEDVSLGNALRQVREMFADANMDKEGLLDLYGFDAYDELKNMVKSVDLIMRTVGDNVYVLNNMSQEELETLDRIVQVIKSTVTKLNKFHMEHCDRSVSEVSQQSMKDFHDLGKAKVFDPKKWSGKLSRFLNWKNKTPFYAFKMFGETGRIIFEAFQDGYDKLAFNIKRAMDYANEVYKAEEIKAWNKEVHEFEILAKVSEEQAKAPNYKPRKQMVKLSVPQMMSLYCLWKREQAKTHILGGGITIANFKEGNKVVAQPESINISEREVQEIVSKLSKRQIEVAEKLQEFMNTVCSDWGNEITMKRWGIKQFTEENYFPIQSDADMIQGDVQDDAQRANSLYRLLNMSFTKALVENANNPVMVSNIFDVFAQHATDMAKYNALALPVLDANKWFNYREKGASVDTHIPFNSVKKAMKSAFGEDAQGYVTTFLKDLNGTQNVSRDVLGGGFFKNSKIAAVGFNLKVMALQPTSYVRARAVIDGKYLVKAFRHKPKFNHAKEWCGMALLKSMGYYDTNIQSGFAEQIKHEQTTMDKIVEASMKGAGKMDEITLGYLWNACEFEIRDTRKDLKVGSDEFNTEVGKRLRDIIYQTQVVDSVVTRSEMMRSPDGRDKLFTAFMSEPTVSYNMLADAIAENKLAKRKGESKEQMREHKKKLARTVYAYAITSIATGLLEAGFEAFRGYGGDDDDEEEFVQFMKSWAENTLLNLSILNKIPYAKDLVSILQGFSIDRSDAQWMEFGVKFGKDIGKMIAGEGNALTTAKDGLKAVSYFAGLPISNVTRDTMAALDFFGILEEEDLEEILNDATGQE